MSTNIILPWQDPAVIRHSQHLCQSFAHWTGQNLLASHHNPETQARYLYEAAFAVLSHGLEADPILNYGNQVALNLWQMTWQAFTQMPSRLTAEPMERTERDRLLAMAAAQNYISGYRGVRIASTGARFEIIDAMIWDLIDQRGQKLGQAARFNRWQPYR
ncbi:MAG: MEKHLA domain-containing protein [Aphanocapsa sp. GSE-SYN-MK-11-07L]|jgi:hypothetical protein|nr:MEKHLA domain-containing protein [Aphanocapsa sp. GSE-SYN-MK-11-07L]